MRILVALGGNALLKRGEPMTAATQRANVDTAAVALAALIAAGHQLVITHGNGPQVGLIALQAAAGPTDGVYPLDILGAESEGMIGYLIELALRNLLPPGALVACLLTQTRVSATDPAFQHPTKPIGPVYSETEAKGFAKSLGWSIAPDGPKWRRVVASPEPLEILEAPVIAMLADGGVTVICAGGGGIPVVNGAEGGLAGIEAVIDKDRASALLAISLKAGMLLLLTDVDAVYRDYGKSDARRIPHLDAATIDPKTYAAGSMRPKVEAAAAFAKASSGKAAIGRLQDATAIIAGAAGTIVTAAR
jgi:carbamate kinase